MHPNALLERTAELLHSLLRFDAPADSLVSTYFRQHRELGPRERHTLAETGYAVLRQRLLLQHLAEAGKYNEKGPIERRLAILGWQGNEAFLRAALSPAEQAWLADVQKIDRAALPDKLRHNLPDWIANPLREALGDGFWPLVESLAQPAPLDLRVNALKARRDEVQAELAAAGIESAPTPFSPWGLRLAAKPALNKLPSFIEGRVEVQDEGSQLLALLLDARRGEMVVDFCAGAGGKTLAIGAAMRSTGRLYAFDVAAHRLEALKPRLKRSGLSNVYPAAIAHERDERIKRLAGKIDRVLVDAPCSGLGTLRRNPDLKWRQSPKALAELHERQQAILAGAARLVKSGGRLVYATCSLLAQENEKVAEAFDAAHGADFAPLPAADALAAAHVPGAESLVAGPYLRLWPHRHLTDGFFAAVWQRR